MLNTEIKMVNSPLFFATKECWISNLYIVLIVDINECKESAVPVCSQVCTDVKGHYKCSCVEGYTMEHILEKPGKTTCKANGMFSL